MFNKHIDATGNQAARKGMGIFCYAVAAILGIITAAVFGIGFELPATRTELVLSEFFVFFAGMGIGLRSWND